jgi:hypothetical protein
LKDETIWIVFKIEGGAAAVSWTVPLKAAPKTTSMMSDNQLIMKCIHGIIIVLIFIFFLSFSDTLPINSKGNDGKKKFRGCRGG